MGPRPHLSTPKLRFTEGWVPGTPTRSVGPNSGAMGVHYLLLSRLVDWVLQRERARVLDL